jgi:DNA-directed RNA polymerase specialized sigma24 family protein
MVNHLTTEERDLSIMYLRHGVPEAFKLLFFEHYPEYFSFSLLLMQHRPEAQKLTMEAFFLLWDRRSDFDGAKKIKAFLYLTLRTKCLQELKSPSSDAKVGIAALPSSLPADILRDIFDYAARIY